MKEEGEAGKKGLAKTLKRSTHEIAGLVADGFNDSVNLGISLGKIDAKIREPALSLETAYLIAESFLERN